jgi:hypothetical protein
VRITVADRKIGHFNVKPKSTVISQIRASGSDHVTAGDPRAGGEYA